MAYHAPDWLISIATVLFSASIMVVLGADQRNLHTLDAQLTTLKGMTRCGDLLIWLLTPLIA
jgi:hypothetical protein